MKRPRTSYTTIYRKAKKLVQLNATIDRSTKEKLDIMLNEREMTTKQFVEQSIDRMEEAEAAKLNQEK